jgi:hypothetical protein
MKYEPARERQSLRLGDVAARRPAQSGARMA